MLREKGITLYGPSPEAIVAPISQAELMQTLQDNAREWRQWITQTELIHLRKYQAHMILTMCRELYRFNHDGQVVSKKVAAQWATKQLPEWSPLIENALVWRDAWRDAQVDHDATLPETLRFIDFVLSRIESGRG